MGSQERKDREKAELKEHILEAAKKILLKSGKKALSIRKIAGMIEYSPATIYLYFHDKDQILHELMEMGFMRMNKYMVSAFAEKDPVLRIREIGAAYVKFAMENRDWYDIMFNSDEPMKHMEKCRTDWDEGMAMFNFLSMTCQEAITKMKVKNLDPQIVALHLWSCVHGLVNLAITERIHIVESENPEKLIGEVLDSVMSCMFV